MKKPASVILLFLLSAIACAAQDFVTRQRSQERVIKTAYKQHRVTPNEYEKLIREQDAIRYAIEKYAADGIWTPHEKNVVAGKLDRAAKRIRRYKTNNERF